MENDFAATAKPFAGVVLCCTGVAHDERTRLVNFAQQMGAVFKPDLRSDVTHMVVGNVSTPKYQFAAQHRFDLKIMDLKWIEDAYEKWIQGDDLNLQESVNSHILPPLSGLNVCLTNVSSQEERKLIEQQIRSHGGEYHPDLSRQCTHLLCASASGKKYEAALKWGVACVGIEWLCQSIERGMALDAKFFTLDIAPEKRGEGAWDRNEAAFGHSAAISTTYSTVPPETENGTRKRRLRRTASEVAQQGILDDIFNGITEANFQAFEQHPFQEVPFVPPIPILEESANEGCSMNLDNAVGGLFDGMVFYTWGFSDKKRQVLADVISSNGGLMFTKPIRGSAHHASKTFTVIPYTIPVEEIPHHHGASELVTEMWIERCIAANSTPNPSDLAMCKPMPGPFPRPYLDNIAISITGFSGPDLLHIERLICLLGAQYYSNLTRRRSLLLTPDRNIIGPKMAKAREWAIPVVSVGWLWEVIARGNEEIEIGPWSERNEELKKFTSEEASGSVKPTSGNMTSCPPAVVHSTGSILDDCVIFVSKKLEPLVPELHPIAKQLGAEIADKFDQKHITHMIHRSSRNAESFREFRLARSENIHIVHPQWLYECLARGMRCDEEAWGWMWDAEKSLTVIGTAESSSARAAPTEPRREKRIRQDENVPPNDPANLEQLTKLLGNISSPQRKVKRRLAGRAQNLQHSNTTSSIPFPENDGLNGREEDNEFPRSTQDRVQYKDPVAEREMAKIVANLQGTAEQEEVGAQVTSNEMTPAEDVGTRSSRRKARK